MRILIVSSRLNELSAFLDSLTAMPDVTASVASTAEEALEAARTSPPALMVIDEGLDMRPLEMAAALLRINAMINTAVMSGLTDEEFHEASEGLGVLCRLPLDPSADDALEVSAKLRAVCPG